MNAKLLTCLLAVWSCASALHAQFSLQAPYRCTGSELLKAFEPQRQVLQRSSALIMQGRDEVGYGTVISPDGHILTKASVFERLDKPVVIVGLRKYEQVICLATDERWDVSLIKIEASGLEPVVYAPTSAVPMGSWVVANGVSSRTRRRHLMGVVSAAIRRIPPEGGLVLGLVFGPAEADKDKDGGAEGGPLQVTEVVDGSGAHAAGIQVGDILKSVAGSQLSGIDALREALDSQHAGDRIEVGVLRDDEALTFEVELLPRSQIFEQPNRNDMMSGDFSERRSDFPRILQHSILGNSKSMGGPLLDLDGRCLGMNIARANRAESYAIPVEDLKALAGRLMGGAAVAE